MKKRMSDSDEELEKLKRRIRLRLDLWKEYYRLLQEEVLMQDKGSDRSKIIKSAQALQLIQCMNELLEVIEPETDDY